MLFNSLSFLWFFIALFSVYWSVPARYSIVRNGIILIASYVFYGFWDWRFLILIVVSTLVDFVSGIRIHQTKSKLQKRFWLSLSIAVNLGLLGFFKYYNFFIDSFITLFKAAGFHVTPSTLNIILPVGISFYTFQTLSYSIDVYRGSFKPTKNLLNFAAFVAFFPQLVAGPIERAASLLPQFNSAKLFNYNLAMGGITLMIYGFFKKVVIADNLGMLVDPLFANPQLHMNWEVLLGFIGFAFQIYADFSGYSDIAIGLAAVFGFKLSTNFRVPYTAKNLRDFWSRWHITLYAWFRDYVYIPLGGNRISKNRTRFNVLITFGLSGLWHGAGFNFIAFGVLHGVYYLVEKRYLMVLPKWLIRLSFLLFIMLVWGVFRASSMAEFGLLLSSIFKFGSIASMPINPTILGIAASMLVFLGIEHTIKKHENFSAWLTNKQRPIKITVVYLLVFWTIIFGAFNTAQNFIYFQF